ncbi:MAG: lycopene cyclase domain-containing protein [Microgenomates group bacterium]
MKLEYLVFNLIIFFLPIFASFFYPKINYPTNFQALFSIFISSLIFIIHDNKVANKWWRFNKRFILGIKIFNLPTEEILFFLTVSFSCLTLWLNLKNISNLSIKNYFYGSFHILIFIFYHFLFLKTKKPYPKFVNFFYFFILFFDIFFKTHLVFKLNFLIFILITYLLTLIFNFYLTKRPVVLYNEQFKSGLKILSIPIEDFLYGINFLYLTIFLFEFLSNNSIFFK